jgi:membrane-associated phospholipid phosphatase
VLRALAPQRLHGLIECMHALGYEPEADTGPARVGRRAAVAVLAMRANDGANAGGDFTDTTGYRPQPAGTPAAWQQIAYLGRPQLPTTPHWSRVLPFGLTRADQFRPPPPLPGSPEWTRQIETLLDASAALTDAQKAAAEYWAPWGSSPAPHLIEITKLFSDANDLRLDDDAKLFFAVSNAILDASIATWEAKYHYDYVRAITAIQVLGDRPVREWHARSLPVAFAYSTPLTRGLAATAPDIPSAVPVEMRAADWQPYLPTPAFPAYVSGHSAMTAAWARVMELVTDGAELRLHKTVRHLFVEQRDLAEPVTLDYTTFASAVTASGMSRIWGGIHWPADDIQGRALGERVGENAWQRARQFVLGTASPAAAVMAFLRPPFWFHDGEAADASFHTAGGLGVNLLAGGRAMWRSIIVDAMPVQNLNRGTRRYWKRRTDARLCDERGTDLAGGGGLAPLLRDARGRPGRPLS